MQPRYHLEMALLRWIHLRKLVPLTDLIDQMGGRGKPDPVVKSKPPEAVRQPEPGPATLSDGGRAAVVKAIEAKRVATPQAPTAMAKAAAAGQSIAPASRSRARRNRPRSRLSIRRLSRTPSSTRSARRRSSSTAPSWRRRSGSTSRRTGSCSSSARSIARCARSSSSIAPGSSRPRAQLAGRRMAVVAAEGTAGAPPAAEDCRRSDANHRPQERQQALKQQALADGRPGDARRVRRRDQGCRGDVDVKRLSAHNSRADYEHPADDEAGAADAGDACRSRWPR